MTSQNICRNIHPVFVVLLAVSKYEILIKIQGLLIKYLKYLFIAIHQNSNYYILCIEYEVFKEFHFRYIL